MLWRAIIAFLALPGVAAFAVPLAIGLNQPRSIPLRPLGWPILVAGVSILVWCVVEFYGAGRAIVLLAFHIRVIVGEEPWLARTFGADWQSYRTRVPRWF